MHSANLQPLYDYLRDSVSELFTIETYSTRLDAKLKGIDGVCDKAYIRPNGKAKAREIGKKTYAVTYPLALIFELVSIKTDVVEVIEYFKTVLHQKGDIVYTAWDDFNEDVYKSETGDSLKNCESRLGKIEFQWTCLENICQQNIKIECK